MSGRTMLGLAAVGLLVLWGLWMGRPARAGRRQESPSLSIPLSVPGARLYAEACLSCHGSQGNGRNPFPIPGGLRGPALDRLSPARWTPGRIAAVIAHGDPPMPGWGAVLSVQQIDELSAYVRSVMTPHRVGERASRHKLLAQGRRRDAPSQATGVPSGLVSRRAAAAGRGGSARRFGRRPATPRLGDAIRTRSSGEWTRRGGASRRGRWRSQGPELNGRPACRLLSRPAERSGGRRHQHGHQLPGAR